MGLVDTLKHSNRYFSFNMCRRGRNCAIIDYIFQGKKVYYHKILIESSESKEVVSVKCITTEPFYNVLMMNATKREHHAVVRRDVLPAGFQEPE